ncbi:peptide ABC transporter substrate-binding protein [Vibrio mediterranei]
MKISTLFKLISLMLTFVWSTLNFAADIPANTQLAVKQHLVRGNFDEPPSFDPAFSSTGASSSIVNDMFEGLVTQDLNGNIVPALATHWDVSNNGLTYTFYLRDGIKWSDGTPITAHDFEFEFKRVIDPKTGAPYAWYYEAAHIKNASEIIQGKLPAAQLGVKALNDSTLELTLDKAIPYFTSMLIHESLFAAPEHVINKFGIRWTRPENIVVSSAFKMTEHVVNERVEVVRNLLYWNNEKTVINKVTYLALSDAKSEYNRFQTGEISMTGHIPVGMVEKIKKDAPETLVIAPKVAEYFIGFNATRPPFNDDRLRKAIAYSIDRDVIAHRIFHKNFGVAYSFVPPATANYTLPDAPWGQLTQQQREQKARELYKEAGYDRQHPLEITFEYASDSELDKLANAVAAMLKKNLGVHMSLHKQDVKAFIAKRRSGDFDILSYQWGGDYNEASTFLDMFAKGGYNPGKWSNAEYDRIIARAKTTASLTERNNLYHQGEAILMHDMPASPIYFETKAILKQPNLKGYSTTSPLHIRYSRDMYFTQ